MDTITLNKIKQTQRESLLNNEKKMAEIILQILDSARKITCTYDYKERPWQVIFATSEEPHFPKLFGCLDLFNQKCHSTAKVLGVILEKKYFNVFGTEVNNNFYDSEVFMTALKLKAEKFNCSIHQMFGFSRELIKEQFEITYNYEPKVMFTIGNPNLSTIILSPNYLKQIDLLMKDNVEFNEI